MKSYDFKEALELQNEGIPSRLGLGTPRLFSAKTNAAEIFAAQLCAGELSGWDYRACRITDREKNLGKAVVVLDENADFVAFWDVVKEANSTTRDRITRAVAVAVMCFGVLLSSGFAEAGGDFGPAASGFTLITEQADIEPEPSEADALPIWFDVAVVRPARFFNAVDRVALFGILSPGIALSRPKDFRMVWKTTVVEQFRETSNTPLGQDAEDTK